MVTGPTGSRKTTTLYTALSKLNSDHRKIVIAEDQIEYTLAGVNQIQVHPEIDLTFGNALRAILRQDLDVVMVGEIRDAETAENAVRAALMGRMVLSTVHTSSAHGAIDRLVDLGVPPFLLGAILRGVMSQRLLRKLCTNYKAPFDAERAKRFAAKFRLPNTQHLSFADPVGCDDCSSGYAGRSVVAEIIEITPELSEAIERGASAGELKALAQQSQSLSEVGLHKAAS